MRIIELGFKKKMFCFRYTLKFYNFFFFKLGLEILKCCDMYNFSELQKIFMIFFLIRNNFCSLLIFWRSIPPIWISGKRCKVQLYQEKKKFFFFILFFLKKKQPFFFFLKFLNFIF